MRVLLFVGFVIIGLLLTVLVVGFLTSHDEDDAMLVGLLAHSASV